jgi:NADPH-dependent glutamate synthase beta subunit-like oxidoreductase/NAD(P)H-flavin reductase
MGMGPAGFTLAHHLLMEGFAVVGVDGLKIEPLPEHFIKEPIYHFDTIKEELDERVMTGFGGVAEYGITVRWDKNFLKLIYMSLLRRPYFQVFGGVRFGGTIKVEDAWELGFDHMAIAVGAGLPRELSIPGSLAPGMRQANDFLMALQLTGAAKKTSLANLQVRLPAVVIGGGLTGIDTATEVQAYYITQVEKTLARYEKLAEVYGAARVREHFDELSFNILNEFLLHGREVRKERERAANENRPVNFMPLLRSWGGVTVAYRGLLKDSPAYRRNHEEIIKAMEEGIYYAEGLTPKAARVDQFGYVEALVSESRILNQEGQWETSDEEHVLPARSIFVATGAKPNIAYEFEHRGTFHREGHEYQAYDANGELKVVHPHGHCKIEEFGAFTSYKNEEYRVSFLGDTHPVFHGSVVKAIASAKRAYPKIVHTFHARSTAVGDLREYHLFAEKMQELFTAKIIGIQRHSSEIIELTVHAPLATKNYEPGHFYRIQNFESSSIFVDDTLLQTEAVAALGTKVNKETGNISLMIMERGASSRLFSTFEVGQAIALMGPTGVKTKIPSDKETILFFGGRLGAAHLRAIGPSLREAGNRVLFIANFTTAADVYCQEDLELAADKIIWVTQTGAPVKTSRPQDRAITADFIGATVQYAMGQLDGPEGAEIPFQEVNRIFVIGSHQLLRDIQKARQTVLKDYFTKNPVSIGSVYGPMQCMLKGVCAQCLTWQIDPSTGKRTKAVFACSWHDQPLEVIDLGNLEERLSQNRAQEILTDLWLDYLLAHYHIAHI